MYLISGFINLIIIWTLSACFATSQVCPTYWLPHKSSCYRFSRSPKKDYHEAVKYCEMYNSKLVSVNNYAEHSFITDNLKNIDPLHIEWWTSAKMQHNKNWRWEGDDSNLVNFNIWLNHYNNNPDFIHASYNFSLQQNRWGLVQALGSEKKGLICEVNQANIQLIRLKEINIDYGVNVIDPDQVPRGPVFEEKPESVVFDLSERSYSNYVILRCVAKGYPTPTYKWYKEEYNGTKVVANFIDPLRDKRLTQTDGTLMIFNPQKETDKGNYHCTASNQFGTIISETVEVNFGYIGQFSAFRAEDFAQTNWGKAISCDAPQHYPRVMYHWSKNYGFPNFVEQDQRVFVSNDGNLYISSVEIIDQANYSCNVQSSISKGGRTGPSFFLRVDSAPNNQKLIFPNNFPKAFPEAPVAGQRVVLECVAFGYPVPSYNWSRTGVTERMPDSSSFSSYNRLLIIPEIKVEDSGEYWCHATSGVNRISKSVTLSIQSLPVFVVSLNDQVVSMNSDVVWTCEAFGIPDVKYQWYKNGQVLDWYRLNSEEKNRYIIKQNILKINLVSELDNGMYQCKAYNQLGSKFSSGQLKVTQFAPTFEKFPLTDMYAAVRSRFVVPCLPEAIPAPNFQWLRNDRSLSSGRMRVLPNGFLEIYPVEKGDEGWFICIASNLKGTGRSQGYLNVFKRSHILEYPRPKVVGIVNDTIQLPCDAHSDPNLDKAFIWFHNDIKIDFNRMTKFSVGKKTGYLKIENINFAEAGNYTCLITTSVDKVATSTTLIVNGPPNAPGAVRAEDLTSTSVNLQWTDGDTNGRNILFYKIFGKTNHNRTWQQLSEIFTPLRTANNRRVALVNGLSPWSIYEFRVLAVNELGEGDPSQPSPLYNTLQDKPFKSPSNVGGGGGKSGTLTLTWDPLPPQDWNAPSIWYKVFYRPEENYEFEGKELKSLGNVGMYAINVGEENYYKKYFVKVQAINYIGAGPESVPKEIFSAESMPQVQPSLVKAVPFNSTALNVSWAPLELSREKIRGKLIGHRIKYWPNNKDPSGYSLTYLNRGEQNHGLIVALTPQTEYYVTVMAYNEAGSGPESEAFLARTFKAAPLRPPSAVKVSAIDDTTVSVTWRGVDTTNIEEPIIGYKVRYWEADQGIHLAKEVYKYLDGEDLKVIIPGLIRGKTYKLRVLAYSKGGDGKMSSPAAEFKVKSG